MILIDSIIRNNLKKKMTNNLGKIVETEDEIICYVNKNNCPKDGSQYYIYCGYIKEEEKEQLEKYNLNKPICFVFDNLFFERKKVNIFGNDNTKIIIKNSDFYLGLKVKSAGLVKLENLYIAASKDFVIKGRDVCLKNMNIKNRLFALNNSLYFSIEGDNSILLDNSNLGEINNNIDINVVANNNLNLINSSICADSIVCESKKIVADEKSRIIAKDSVEIITDAVEDIKVVAPSIIVNGKLLNDSNILFTKIVEPLVYKRLEFLNLLKGIKEELEIVKENQLSEYEKQLNNLSVKRMLKK